MACNVGGMDRILRIVIGAIVSIATLLAPGFGLSWLVFLLGIVVGISGIIGYCPLYTVLKVNTGCKAKS